MRMINGMISTTLKLKRVSKGYDSSGISLDCQSAIKRSSLLSDNKLVTYIFVLG